MARFRTEGLDDLIKQMADMGQTTGELAEKMLFSGADVIKQAWKRAAEMNRLHDTGDMIKSINFSRKVKRIGDILSVDIYPQGKDRKGVRNAEKAFILHYGTHSEQSIKKANLKSYKKKKYKNPGIPATHWVDDADDIAGPLVEKKLTEIFDEWLKKHAQE